MTSRFSQEENTINNAQLKESFGIFIKKHRVAKKMTQEELAIALGVTKKFVCYFESGRTFPSQENIFKLATILDMSLDEFVFGISHFNHEISIPTESKAWHLVHCLLLLKQSLGEENNDI